VVLLLRFLDSIFTSCLHATDDTAKVDCPTNDFVPHTRQILSTTTTHQDHAVFLQVMAFSLNVRHDRVSIGQLDSSDLALGRVRLLGFHDKNLGTDTLFLGTDVEKRGLCWVEFLGLLAPHSLVESDGE